MTNSSTDNRTIQFKSFYWNYEETDEKELFIHVGGRTANDESVHCKITGFTPFVYLELPKRVRWNKAKCIALFEYFKKVMKDDGPLQYWLQQKYTLKHKKLFNAVCLSFPNNKGALSIASRCRNSKSIIIEGVGTFYGGEFKIHEHNIDPILKFTATKDIKLAGWIEVTETIPDVEVGLSVEDRKYTTADIDLIAEWGDVRPYHPPEMIIVKPIYFGFDIECYSKNHNSKLPDPTDPENEIFSISIETGRVGDSHDTTSKVLLTLWNPHDIKGVDVRRFATEKDLLIEFRDLVNETNPDIFITYNGMKFDWHYIIKRCELLGIYMKVAQMSRVYGKRADLKKVSWSSSAYGEQEFLYLDPCGRTNVDVILEVERNYKLPKYNLDHVAEHFLKKHKDDVTPRQLFMLYQLTKKMTSIVVVLPDNIIPKDQRIQIKTMIQNILPRRRCHGVVLDLRKKLMNAKKGAQFKKLVRDALTITGTYNVQDTVLAVELCEKLNLWTTMEATSNCMNVPISYLHTRGQQIKVLAQVYRETLFRDIVIPFKNKDAEIVKYQGAVVIEANPGDYNNVVCLDFESLYPSIMIAFNICYTTLLEDDDPTPDSECNVIEFSDHIGCKCDPKKRKKKKADILCKDHRYRFRKVIIHADGTREHEGIMPMLERRLLSERKSVKKDMAKLDAKYKMAVGIATPEDIAYYTKCGWDIIKKDSLTKKEIEVLKIGIQVLNAHQLALKVSANSVRSDTPIPCMVNEEFKYMHIEDLAEKGTWKKDNKGGEVAEPLKGVQVWSDIGFTDIKYVFRHPSTSVIKRVVTHTGSVDVTEDHSLLDSKGNEVLGSEIEIGDELMHVPVPTPKDTPTIPKYKTLTNDIISKHKLETSIEKQAFIWGLFFAKGTCELYSSLHKKKSSWIIYNQDLSLLTRAKNILNRIENDYTFEIRDYRSSSNTYCLNPLVKSKSLTELVEKYGKMFYNNRGCKKIPDEILRANISVREAFFVGYYAGDGGHHLNMGIVMQNKGNLGTSQLCYLAKTLGYKVSISHQHDDNYRLECCTKFRIQNYTAIKNISDIPEEIDKITQIHVIRNEDEPKDEKITYECPLCENIELRVATMGIEARSNKTCKCEAIYTHTYTSEIDNLKDYVYDIETKSHHFAAGIGDLIVHNSAYGGMGAQTGFIPLVEGAASVTAMGRKLITEAIRYVLEKYKGVAKLVYGDTDSSMITFTGKTTEESFALGDKISKEVSHYLKTYLLGFKEDYEIECPDNRILYRIDKYPRDKMSELDDEKKIHIYQYDANPINLQFENLYKRYFLLTKKRYVARATNRKGEITAKIKKGVVTARRDGCFYLHDTYNKVMEAILDDRSENEVMNIIYDSVNKLFTRQVPDANLIQYTAVKNIISYAKKLKIKNRDGTTTETDTYIDEEGDPVNDPSGPLDPRLVYPNLPQVLLTLKMIKRGDDVPPNTRLEYIYLENPEATHQGEKAEDYTFYKENKEILNLKPDYLHYIEKQLSKPLTEVINVKYPRVKVPYESIDDRFERCVSELSELLKHRVRNIKTYDHTDRVEHILDSKIKIGWDVIGKRGIPFKGIRGSGVQTYKKQMAQVQYILTSMKKKKMTPTVVNEIDSSKYPELFNVCLELKSRHVLDNLHYIYGLRKRSHYKPTQTGAKLRVKTKDEFVNVFLTKDIGKYKKHTIGTLQDIREVESDSDSSKTKKIKSYFYTLKMPDDKILENIPRSDITTWYYKDSKVMEGILSARMWYSQVIDELNHIFKGREFRMVDIEVHEIDEIGVEDE